MALAVSCGKLADSFSQKSGKPVSLLSRFLGKVPRQIFAHPAAKFGIILGMINVKTAAFDMVAADALHGHTSSGSSALRHCMRNNVNMPINTEKQVKDFMIAYGINAVLESSHCEIKRNRTIEDFIEYLKYYVQKLETIPSLAEDLPRMIVEFFGSDNEFPFEIVKKIREIEKQADDIESELTELGVD